MDSETERLKGLLREWLAEFGVYQSSIHSYVTGGQRWTCASCEAYSTEGPDQIVHTAECLAEKTERVLAECEADKEV